MDDFEYKGQSGFQSPATEYAQSILSLDKYFALKNPSMFLWRATGGAGKRFPIKEGDLLIVNRRLNKPVPGGIYVFHIAEEFLMGEYQVVNGRPMLLPHKIYLDGEFDFAAKVFGGVMAIVNIYVRPKEKDDSPC